jgi:hypothetical protein
MKNKQIVGGVLIVGSIVIGLVAGFVSGAPFSDWNPAHGVVAVGVSCIVGSALIVS